MSGLGDLSSFVENEQQSIVDLSWLNVTPGENYDNIPSDNVAEKIPELEQAWAHQNNYPHQFIPNQVAQTSVGDAQVSITPEMIEDVAIVVKKAMMLGLKGSELSAHVSERFPEQQIKAASEELKKVAAEQGLLGNVYVDLSCFDTCKQASLVLGKHRTRLAAFAVGKPRKEPNFIDGFGNARDLGKKVVASIEYTPELLAQYEQHLKTAGLIEASDKISSKEDLQSAFLNPKAQKAAQEIRQATKSDIKDLSEEEINDKLASLKATSKEASSGERFYAARKVLSFMQGQMLKGKMGDSLKEVVTNKFASDVLSSFAPEVKRIASLQGLQGQLYVDVSLFQDAKEAVAAIKKASTKPQFLIQSFRKNAFDHTLESVSAATGLPELPRDGSIDPKIARDLIASLELADKISLKSASILREKLDNNLPALGVIREANLLTLEHKKEAKSSATYGTEHVSSAPTPKVNHDEVLKATKVAFEKGFAFEEIESKVAKAVPAVEAHSMVREVLSSLDEVKAESLTKCATEKYPLKKGAKIASCASKCASCVHSANGFCTKQASAFVGSELDTDLVLPAPGSKVASATINDEFQMVGIDQIDIDFSNVVEPPKVSGFDSGIGFGREGVDSYLV